MNTTKYMALRSQIKARYRDNLVALERVWRLANPDKSLPSADMPAEPTPAAANKGKGVFGLGTAISEKPRLASGEVVSAVGQAIGSLKIFDWKDVRRVIIRSKPGVGAAVKRTSIVQVLQNMVESSELVVHQKGAGRRATQYRKAIPPSADSHAAPPDKPKLERVRLDSE